MTFFPFENKLILKRGKELSMFAKIIGALTILSAGWIFFEIPSVIRSLAVTHPHLGEGVIFEYANFIDELLTFVVLLLICCGLLLMTIGALWKDKQALMKRK